MANAVLDGADAVMLLGETSVGRFPIESVNTMSRIVSAAEASFATVPPLITCRTPNVGCWRARPAISASVEAKALVAFTQSGDTARRLARLHTPLPLLAFTPEH